MEIPSVLYIHSLYEQVQDLTKLVEHNEHYIKLKELNCIFFDAFVMYDSVTKSQFEFDKYYINYNNVKDFNRLTEIIHTYTELIKFVYQLNRRTHCVNKFKELSILRHAFYKQLIRERVYNNLRVYYKNGDGIWEIKPIEIEMPFLHYELYELRAKKPIRTGKSRIDRMRLYLTEDDVKQERYSLMMCEKLFDDLRKELGIFG